MKREWVWAIISLVIAIVLSYILVSLAHDAQSKVDVCVTSEQRDHIREVMLKAVDNALDNQIDKLFANWVLDNTGQPKRAQVGTNNAIRAFIVARAAVLNWDPHECTASFQLQSAEAIPWR